MKKLFIIAIFVLFTITMSVKAEENHFVLRNGICFGDTIEQIREKEGSDLEIVDSSITISDSDNYEEYHTYSWTTLAGIETDIIYYMNKEGRLEELLYYMGKGLSVSDYKMLADALIKKYGDPCDKDYGFRGMAFDFSGVEKVNQDKDILVMIDPLERNEWIVKTADGIVVIQLIRYDMNMFFHGKSLEDGTQGRLGYVLLSEDEYESVVSEKEKAIQEEQEKKEKEQEKKEKDLVDNI